MSQGRPLWALLFIVAMICGPGLAAAAPWDKLLATNRVDADPEKEYPLTEQNGPWTILACSFSGPHAAQQAHDLVLELRRRYKLPAYVYEKKFNLTIK